MKLSIREENEIRAYIESILEADETKQMKDYMHHGTINTYDHVMDVVYMSYWINKKLRITNDVESLLIGACLHDYFLYDWHNHQDLGAPHGVIHPSIALKNAEKRYDLNEKVRNIIDSHMWPLAIRHIPRCREAVIVTCADKICATFETITRSKLLFCVNM